MKRNRHVAEQIILKLKTAAQLIAQRKTVIDVTELTYHRLRQHYGGIQVEEPGV